MLQDFRIPRFISSMLLQFEEVVLLVGTFAYSTLTLYGKIGILLFCVISQLVIHFIKDDKRKLYIGADFVFVWVISLCMIFVYRNMYVGLICVLFYYFKIINFCNKRLVLGTTVVYIVSVIMVYFVKLPQNITSFDWFITVFLCVALLVICALSRQIITQINLMVDNANEQETSLDDLLHLVENKVKEAELANKAKGQFLANMSHEIRTPMNAIVGMVEVLIRDETDAKKIDYLKNVKDSGNHLLEIINDILDFSKVESGKLEIIPDIYEVRARIDSLEMLLNERIGAKDIELIFDIDEAIPRYMYGDATRLRQVIINLVNNAIKFTEKGFVKVTSKVVDKTDEDVSLYFCVEDSGIGIKAEEMDKLFGAFNRLDKQKTAKIEGTGLGLSLSKQLVSLMGGNIQVESTYGVGTKFFFTIKQGIVKETDIKAKEAENKKNEKEGKMFKAPKAKILLAEDSKVNVKVFKALIAPVEAQIDVAENGQIAVDKVKENDYDIVFMDHMMPVMNGLEATSCIRQLDNGRNNALIIALTANAVVGVKEQFIEAGMDDYLSKPIQIKELLTMMRRYLPKEYIEEID